MSLSSVEHDQCVERRRSQVGVRMRDECSQPIAGAEQPSLRDRPDGEHPPFGKRMVERPDELIVE